MDKRKSVLILFSVLLLVGGVSAQSLAIDGFEDGNANGWVEGDNYDWSVISTDASEGTYSLEVNDTGDDGDLSYTGSQLYSPDSIQMEFKFVQGNSKIGWVWDDVGGSNRMTYLQFFGDTNSIYVDIDGDGSVEDTGTDYTIGQWHTIEINGIDWGNGEYDNITYNGNVLDSNVPFRDPSMTGFDQVYFFTFSEAGADTQIRYDEITIPEEVNAPTVTIDSPLNQTYTSSDIALDVSADKTVDTWQYNIDGGTNQTFTPNTTLSNLSAGTQTINIYANDTSGNTGSASETFTVDVYSGGSGTQSDPYEISNWEELNEVRNNFDSYHELVSDIDKSSLGYSSLASPTANSEKGWEPIGDFAVWSNNVKLYGNGHTVSDYYINRPTESSVGLIGWKDVVEISNINIRNATIEGSDRNTGLFIGADYGGVIENVSVEGEIKNSGDFYTGGFIGYALGNYNNVYVNVNISNSSAFTGAIAGFQDTTNTNVYGFGSIEAGSSNKIGGLYGETQGSVTNAYSTVSVTSSGSDVGGFVGNNNGGSGTDVYWDTNQSGQSTDEIATGLTTSEMIGNAAETNMAFDFTNVWEKVLESDADSTFDGYPVLRAFSRDHQIEIQEQILPLDQNPIANFTFTPSDPIVDETINFDGTGSSDSDGTVSSYEWDFDNDGTYEKTGSTTTYSYSSSGDKVVTLRVTDDDGLTDTSQQTVTVSEEVTDVNSLNPADTETFDFYEAVSNGITFEWEVLTAGSPTYTSELIVDGSSVFSNSFTGQQTISDTQTLSASNYGNTINWYANASGISSTTRSLSFNAPRHTATTVSPSSDTVKMLGNSISWEYDYQYEEGETVDVSISRLNDGLTSSYDCTSQLCTVTESGTFSLSSNEGTRTFGSEITGQDSGYSDSGTSYDVTWYDPSLTYNGPADGSTVSYPNRNQTLNYTWDSSNEESVTAYLYYNGQEIRTDNLSPGDSITETVEGEVGQNDWYVEVTGDTSGDTETFSTQSFTVEQPQNSFTLNSPADNAEFDSGTSQVTVSTDYTVEEEGNVSFIINGVEEYSESVTVGSGSVSFNYPTQSGEDVTWNATFEGTTGTNDVNSNTRSFTVLQSLASVTPVSPNDGQTFSWDQRDVQFEWNSEANDDYTTRLYVDGTQESSSSYTRGSNVDTHTMTLGNSDQDTTYSYYVETEDVNGNTDTSDTRTFTVEMPELAETATLTSPANDTTFSEFTTVELEGEVETNDISEYRIIVNGNTVKSQTIGTDDRTDTVSQNLSYSDTYSTGNYSWKIEIGSNSSETREFEIVEEDVSFLYNNPTDGKVYPEGTDSIDYNMSISHETNGTVKILKNGNSIYSENITVNSSGNSENKTITYTESINGNPQTVDWKGRFVSDSGNTITAGTSSSYEIEELPSAVLDSPDDGVYFRNLPESVAHDFNISDTTNEVTSELIVNGEVEETFTGSGQKTGIIDYLEGDVGKQNWTVNTTWTQDTGVEKDTETREYNTGDPDIAEGRAIDRVINYVSDQLGMSYLGAAIMINLTLSMLFAVAVMYKTKSVGYTLLVFGTAFFGLGIIGFLPNILIILLGITAVSVLTIYAWKFTFGGDNE